MLVDICGKLKRETIRVKEDVNKLKKEQQMYYVSSSKITVKVERSVGNIKEISKEIENCKRDVVSLGDRVTQITEQNEDIKRNIEQESEYANRLRNEIKKMKAAIADGKKESDSTRKDILANEKQCVQLKQKCQKTVILYSFIFAYRL